MLEGYPCKPINDMKVRSLQRQAERAFPSTPVHLVPPSREYPDTESLWAMCGPDASGGASCALALQVRQCQPRDRVSVLKAVTL